MSEVKSIQFKSRTRTKNKTGQDRTEDRITNLYEVDLRCVEDDLGSVELIDGQRALASTS